MSCVPEMLFSVLDVHQFRNGPRHLVLQLKRRVPGVRTPATTSSPCALMRIRRRILGAIGRVAGERNTGAGRVAGVAVNHRLHVDGGAPLGRGMLYLRR